MMQGIYLKNEGINTSFPTFPLGKSTPFLSRFVPKFEWVIPASWKPIKDKENADKIAEIAKNDLADGDREAIAKAFAGEDFDRLSPQLQSIFKNLTDAKLNDCLKYLFYHSAFSNSDLLVKRLGKILTLEKVEQAVRTQFPLFNSSLQSALMEARPAERDLHANREENSSLIRLTKFYIYNSLEFIIDTLMFTFQLKNAEDGDADNFQRQVIASMRYEAFRDNLTFLAGCILTLGLAIDNVPLAASIAATVGLIAIVGGLIYVNYLKPCPAEVHPTVELTAKVIKGEIDIVHGRESEVDKLIETWETNQSSSIRTTPMLIGKTGSGKSNIVNALAHRVVKGDVPDFLKGKKIYSVNAADLVSGSPTNIIEHLELIQKRLHGYEKDCILFIDETHCAFDSETHQVLGQKLKTLMDPTYGFPFMIFASTTGEFEKWIEGDDAFVRRIEIEEVKSMSPEDTHQIAQIMVLDEASDLVVDPKAIELAVASGFDNEILKEEAQPWLVKQILAKVFAKKRIKRDKELNESLQKLKSQRDRLETTLKLYDRPSYATEEAQKDSDEIKGLSRSIKNVSIELAKAKTNFENYKSLLNELEGLRTEIKHLSVEIRKNKRDYKLSGKSDQTAHETKTESAEKLMTYILKSHYLKQGMDKMIDDYKKEFQITSINVTVEDVQEVIAEISDNLKSRKEKKEANHANN